MPAYNMKIQDVSLFPALLNRLLMISVHQAARYLAIDSPLLLGGEGR